MKCMFQDRCLNIIFLVIACMCFNAESFSHFGLDQHSKICNVNNNLKSKIGGYHRREIFPSTSSIQWNNAKNSVPKQQKHGLQMGYNLPPSGGGGGGRWKEDFLIPLASLVGLALFFASPLGGIFFAITNSLFILAFLTPLILFLGFQGWQLFYTMEAPCPNCEAPVRILKNEETPQPTICFNCGSMVRKSQYNDGLELCGPPPNDSFFNSNNNDFFQSMEDIFSGSSMDNANSNTIDTQKRRQETFKRERTIIDVEVERDD